MLRSGSVDRPLQPSTPLSNCRSQRNIVPMLSLQPLLRALFLPAICVAGFVIPIHGSAAECELDNIALARVVTKQARLNFVAAGSEQAPTCPSAEATCRRSAYLVPGDEVLTGAADGSYVCALFKSQGRAETTGFLPRMALEMVPPGPAPAQQWDGIWRRDRDTQIVVKSHHDDVEVSGSAVWGSHDPQRVRRGGIHSGELNGKSKPRGHTVAIGYDPERSSFPPAPNEAPDACAAKLELLGRYLMVEDNGGCGGLNVSFTGVYVRAK